MTADHCSRMRSAGRGYIRIAATAAILLSAHAAHPQSLGPAPGAQQDIEIPHGNQIGRPGSAAKRPVPDERQTGFEDALKDVFPMTPDMVRDYRNAFRENETAVHFRPYPEPVNDAALVTLEPGERPVELSVAPGIASVVGFHDAAGEPWPIRQYVLGDGSAFQVAQLGEMSSALAVSPLARVGWTNLVIALAGEESPVVLKVIIDSGRAHFRRSIQVMKLGPGSEDTGGADSAALPAAGSRQMIDALTGAGMGDRSAKVPVSGVDAQAWTLDGQLYVRSRHALLSPPWSASLAGPGGIRAYRLDIGSALLFSVDGGIVQATLDIP